MRTHMDEVKLILRRDQFQHKDVALRVLQYLTPPLPSAPTTQ